MQDIHTGELPFSNGSIFKIILPLMMEIGLNLAIGAADTLMVSSAGETALSGVSLVDSLSIVFVFIFNAFATGGAVVASQYLGAGERQKAEESAKQLMYVTFAFSFLASVLLIVFRKGIFRLIYGNLEKEVLIAALRYHFPLSLSILFMALTNSCNAISRSMGKTSICMKVSMVMNVLNITGNAILIYGFHLGTFGAGLSSLVARICAFFLAFSFLRRPENEIRLEGVFHVKIIPSMAKKIIRIALPTGFESGIFNIGKLLIASTVASLGTAAIAANAVINSAIGNLCNIGAIAVGDSAIPIIGHCCGAGRHDWAKHYMKRLFIIASINMALCVGFVTAVSGSILSLYDLTPEAMSLIREILPTYLLHDVLIWPAAFVLPNFLRAAGDVKYTMMCSVTSMCIFRILFSWILGVKLSMGLPGIWWAMYLDWYCRTACFVFRAISGKWKSCHVI